MVLVGQRLGTSNTPLGHHEIGLVVLQPAKWKSSIKCHLIKKCLYEDPDYQALSYFWSDPNALRPISLQGRIVQLSRSLEATLRHLCYEDREWTLWIDALSINQSDVIEKTQQVRQMHLIYARTHHLIFWITERSEDSDIAMQAMRRIGREQEGGDTWNLDIAHSSSMVKEALTAGDSFDPKPWVTLNRLFRRPWFERIWVPLWNFEKFWKVADTPCRLSKKFACLTGQSRFFAGK